MSGECLGRGGQVADGSIHPTVTGEYRIGDARHTTASPERAERLLGFRAQIDAPTGLRGFATAPMRVALDDATAVGQVPSS